MVDELVFLVDPSLTDDVPEGLQEFSLELLRKSKDLRTKLIHQRTDRIVQINSALSYITSQLLSGYPPILERRSLIRRYSLLGVSTAAKALVRLARHVEAAFAVGNLESIVREEFSRPLSRPLPGFPAATGHDASEWHEFNVSHFRESVGSIPLPPKLPYFSGRLGFREAEYALSAALQVLWSGDAVEWNLTTMTHELLHGLVRRLDSQIFAGKPGADLKEHYAAVYQRFADLLRGVPPKDMNTLDSIRGIILSYCCLVPTWGSLTSPPSSPFAQLLAEEQHLGDDAEVIEGDVILYSAERLWAILEHQNRNISEILVHVFDLHYFYGSRLSIYLPFLWNSWAAVPGVVRDLRQYVLRTILTVASLVQGTPYERFQASADRVVDILTNHKVAEGPYTLVPQVLAFLGDDETRETLYYPFHAALRIVDLAYQIFFSSEIQSALLANDEFIRFENRGSEFGVHFRYTLNELEFVDEPIASPTAFLLDRLQRILAGDAAAADVERRTAWALLTVGTGLGGSDD
jgi:hypothetical protein